MAVQKFLNNFDQSLVVAAASGDTILQLPAAASAQLGTLTGGDWYELTVYKLTGSVESQIEIVKVTNVDANGGGNCLLTVVRAQEGTTAQAHAVSDLISMRITKGGLDNMAQVASVAAKQDASAKDASGGFAGLTLLKLNLKNAANTITNFLTNATTAARTWTMPDKDGTVAMLSDITGTNSGTNTGDQTGGTPALTLGTANTAGSSAQFIRRDDTILVFDATAPSTQAFSDTAVVGVATTAARRDHKHAMPALALKTVGGVALAGTGDIGTLGVAYGGTGVTTSTGSGANVLATSPTLVTPSLGVASGTSFNSITGLSSTTPAAAGTAAVGTSTTVARADHVHAFPASLTSANFTIVESAGKLLFKYGATTIASLDSAGGFIALANVSAYTTP